MHFKQDITQQANEGLESLQTKKTGFNSSGTAYFLCNMTQTRDSSATEVYLYV